MLVEIQVVILLKQLYIEEGEQAARKWWRKTGFNTIDTLSKILGTTATSWKEKI